MNGIKPKELYIIYNVKPYYSDQNGLLISPYGYTGMGINEKCLGWGFQIDDDESGKNIETININHSH